MFFFFTLWEVDDSLISNLFSVSFSFFLCHYHFLSGSFIGQEVRRIIFVLFLWNNFLDGFFFYFFFGGNLFFIGDFLISGFLFGSSFIGFSFFSSFLLSKFFLYDSCSNFFSFLSLTCRFLSLISFKLNLLSLLLIIFHIVLRSLFFNFQVDLFLSFLLDCFNGLNLWFRLNLGSRLFLILFWGRRWTTREESIDVDDIFQETPLRFWFSMDSAYGLLVKSWLLSSC